MKSLTKLLILIFCSALYTSIAHADVSISIGKNSARFHNADCHFRKAHPKRSLKRHIHRANRRNTIAFNVNIRGPFVYRRHCRR